MAWMAPILAAAAKKRREEEEEEEMAWHLQEELGADWEFKIVRGGLYMFGNPQKLRQMLEEEARAGWEMAGKLDDDRIFLKRPRSARKRDHLLEPGIDPYRTDYGSLSGKSGTFVIVGLLILGVLLFTALVLGRLVIPAVTIPAVIMIVGALVVAGAVFLLVARLGARK